MYTIKHKEDDPFNDVITKFVQTSFPLTAMKSTKGLLDIVTDAVIATNGLYDRCLS